MSLSTQYSGVVINQNSIYEDPGDLFFFSSYAFEVFQTFQLPDQYIRGSFIPSLTGFQVFANVKAGMASTATLTWSLDYAATSTTWITLLTGTKVGCAADGLTWFNVFFDTEVEVSSSLLSKAFRLQLGGGNGLNGVYYSVPNPLQQGQAFLAAGTAITDNSRSISLMFRILAATADTGIDFLGNITRAAVTKYAVANLNSTATVPTTQTNVLLPTPSEYWLSKPNPSQFAVENLYFDMRQSGRGVVIDRMTLDPITPGLFFHVYYSNDTSPGIDDSTWENLLWTPVYKTFQASRRNTYVFPEPITANYVKVEFTQLQPRSYDPGPFQKPTTYKKHPSWVLDYFLAKFATQEHDFLSSGVDVTYDALDLAYTYYKGDIIQKPNGPTLTQPTQEQLQFFTSEDINQVDSKTLALIQLAFQPYTTHPASFGTLNSILGKYALSTATPNYSTETISVQTSNTSIVSGPQRDALVLEKGFPIMYFFIPCRHGYRVTQAIFEYKRAYFAGVREVTFHRDNYEHPADQVQYNETLNDGNNAAYNDFLD